MMDPVKRPQGFQRGDDDVRGVGRDRRFALLKWLELFNDACRVRRG